MPSPDPREAAVVVGGEVRAAVGPRDKPLGAAIASRNLRLDVPFLVANGSSVLALCRERMAAAVTQIVKSATALEAFGSTAVSVDVFQSAPGAGRHGRIGGRKILDRAAMFRAGIPGEE